MSVIVETPVAVVARALAEVWWYRRHVAFIVWVVDTNGSDIDSCFTRKERTGQCLMRLVKADLEHMLDQRPVSRRRERRVFSGKRRQSGALRHHRG